MHKLAESTGVNDAEKLCKYFSKVYQQESCTFDNLEPNLQNAVISIGQHYMQNLQYPAPGTPGFLKADTPANVQRTKEVQKDVFFLLAAAWVDPGRSALQSAEQWCQGRYGRIHQVGKMSFSDKNMQKGR